MQGNRIYLRALAPNDYKTSIKWRQDEEVWNTLGGTRYFVSEEYEKQWVESAIFDKDKIVLAICLKKDNRYIGNITLQNIDYINRSGHTQILIGDKDKWSKGYGTEAIMLLLSYAFFEKGLNRITAYVLESNKNSLKMHEKCGYHIEGHLRQSVYKNGCFHNQYVLSVLKEDFIPIFEEYQKKYLS